MKKRVYLVRTMTKDGSAHKIGMTRNVKQRIRGMQTGCPTKIYLVATSGWHDDADKLEGICHKVLSGSRIHGEWYFLSSHDVSRVENTLKDWESIR